MTEIVGSRLPNFTAEEIAKVNGSLDFIGLNVQTAFYTYDKDFYTDAPEDNTCYYLDWGADTTGERDGVPIGEVNLYDEVFHCIS
jgi:beta-glucosidase